MEKLKKNPEVPKLTIFARLKDANLTADGDLIIILEKESKDILTSICSILREYFGNQDIYIYITLLRRIENNES